MDTSLSHKSGGMADNLESQEQLPTLSASLDLPLAEDARPYPPSWVDRLTDRVRRLSMPSWFFYTALAALLAAGYFVLMLLSPQWDSGEVQLDGALLYSVLNGGTGVYLLALIHYLDNSAASALARFRSVLTTGESGYSRLLYTLTTLPARPTLVATLLGLAYTFVSIMINSYISGMPMTDSTTASMSLVGALLVWLFNIFSYITVGVTVYHTLHQLRTVSTIYTEHTRINPFQQGPLYALSGVSARTALGIAVPTYIWFLANSNSETGTTASDVIQTVFLGAMVLVTFVWPLIGAHSLMQREKQHLLDDVGRRIENTTAEMHRQADERALTDLPNQKTVLDGLIAEQGVIEKLRTWPWRLETAQGLLLAFFVPVLIWIVQRILERLGF